jgi:hypothetical protein
MMNEIFFNAHHSPVGAFSTFTLGNEGACGGIATALAGPANQNVYIGVESQERNHYNILPFYSNAQSDRERFESNNNLPNIDGPVFEPFKKDVIARDFSPSIDTWKAGDLIFTIYSPVTSIPDPRNASTDELRQALIPAVFVEFTVDNRFFNCNRKAFFGYHGNDPYTSMRRIDDTTGNDISGIGQGRHTAICTDDLSVISGLAFTINEIISPHNDQSMTFGLGTTGSLVMIAEPCKITTWRFVVCFYRDGIITAGIDACFYYTKFFSSIEEVASFGLLNFEHFKKAAFESDKLLNISSLSKERHFMLSHAIRSYYGCTELLCYNNSPLWIVNEGEYRMINTFDLAVDQLFFEMKMNPWTVRNVLDLYQSRYCYKDSVFAQGNPKEYQGGLSFTHDMGVADTFSRPRFSAYEQPGLKGCFSYMTHEQLVNWILCASIYILKSGDNDWLHSKKIIITECLQSMINRDHFDPNQLDGIMDLDSSRTGDGSEITTYDNVDSALGQARRNTYLAVKCWAAYILLKELFESLNFSALEKLADEQARRCANTIISAKKSDGTLPSILEPGNESVTISIIEGLSFVYFTYGNDPTGLQKRYGDLLNTLKEHTKSILKKGVCLFDDGGWKLSSTNNNSWLSKIYLCQFVSEKIFGLIPDKSADFAHFRWLLDKDNSYFAWSDQMCSGKVCGSRYYPRGVTAILWLE